MQENFLISIVITVYNTEKYLRRCLESVTNQSYRNLEIVVVNDCSPGNAEDIIKEYLGMMKE
nr:glycosyltransferase family 2 protein [Clostridium neonatale]